MAESSYSRSKIGFGLYLSANRKDDIYNAVAAWTLKRDNKWYWDGDGPKDAAGIYVSDYHWQPEGVKDTFHTSLSDINPYGAVFKFNDPNYRFFWDPDFGEERGLFNVKLREMSDNPYANVYFDYIHTWASGGVPGWINVGVGAKGINVGVSGAVDTWTKEIIARKPDR